MELIKRIPVSLQAGEIARRLRLRAGGSGSAQLQDVIEMAQSRIRLRAVYDISYVGTKNAESVEVGGVVFRSRVLRRNLDRAQKVFPYIMTIGPELESTAASINDLLKQYYLEEIANIALEQGITWLSERLGGRWGFPGLSNLSPGSLEDWPITEQRRLFSLFGETVKAVGVSLTDRFLMLPRKSVSGILFPSDEGFTACRLCPRETCPSRRAPYDEALAAENE